MNIVNPLTQKVYETGKILHENADNGIVCYSCTDTKHGDCFIKVVNYGALEGRDAAERAKYVAESESKCLKSLGIDCKGIPKLYDFWDDKKEKRYVIVMEMMQGVTLRSWMKKRPADSISDKDLRIRCRIVRQIVGIMFEIKKKHPAVVHRDLKPENIMIYLDEEKHWKVSIVDFGCAGLNFVRGVGTAGYLAPEQIWRDTPVQITTATDAFAIGQILYELLTGKVPVIGMDYVRIGRNNNWEKRPSLPEKILKMSGGTEINDLLSHMTEFEPNKRWEYPFIYNILNRRIR